jgi:hypothetical protein
MTWQNWLKKWLVCGALCVCPTFANANVVFYVNAHPDDLELFMERNLSHDIYDHPDATAVIVITTSAGDAGLGTGNGSGIAPYYLARELGHVNALQFLEGLTGTSQGSFYTGRIVEVLGKKMYRAQINGHPIIWYNLRLPDGGFDGNGYETTGWQSLAKLDDGRIPKITAVDGSASYTKAELIELFRTIIRNETGTGGAIVWANLVDQDSNRNPGDHSDHQATSRLFTQALAAPMFQCVNQAFFTTYVNAQKKSNMDEADTWIQIGLWGALNQGRNAGGQQNTWDPDHNGWLGKQYYTALPFNGEVCRF